MVWFRGIKVKGQRYRVNKCIFHTNDYFAYAIVHLTDNSNMAGVQTQVYLTNAL